MKKNKQSYIYRVLAPILKVKIDVFAFDVWYKNYTKLFIQISLFLFLFIFIYFYINHNLDWIGFGGKYYFSTWVESS